MNARQWVAVVSEIAGYLCLAIAVAMLFGDWARGQDKQRIELAHGQAIDEDRRRDLQHHFNRQRTIDGFKSLHVVVCLFVVVVLAACSDIVSPDRTQTGPGCGWVVELVDSLPTYKRDCLAGLGIGIDRPPVVP